MSAGTIYTEIDLDFSKFEKNQQKLLQSSVMTSNSIEKNFQNLGVKSDAIFDAMRRVAESSFAHIQATSASAGNEIVRAKEAMSAKLKAIDQEQFGTQTSFLDTLKSLKSNWMAVSATVLAAYYAMAKFKDLAELGATVRSVEESFVLMSRNAGISGDALISMLKKVTDETINSSDLIKKANRLIIEGFSPDQVIQVGAAARVAARLMGTDVSAAYEQIADSIVNLRERGLKTAGFVIDLEEAYKKHAIALGTNTASLNEYGKQMALMEAVHQKTIELQEKLGMTFETTSERMQKQSALWKSFWENIGKGAYEAWDAVNRLGTLISSKAGTTPPWAWGGEEGAYREQQTTFFAEEEHGVGAGRGVIQKAKEQFTEDWKQSVKDAQLIQEAWMQAYVNGTEVQFTRVIETFDFDKARQAFVKKIKAVTDWGVPMQEYRSPTLLTFENINRELEAYGVVLDKDTQKMRGFYQGINEMFNSAELLATVRMQKQQSGAEFTYPTEDILPDWMVDPKTGTPRLVAHWKNEILQWQNLWDGACQSISTSFSSGLFDAFKKGGQGFQGFLNTMMQSFERSLATMASNWMLFGNFTGYQKGMPMGGVLGELGKFLGFGGTTGGTAAYSVPGLGLGEGGGYMFQHGGEFWANKPTLIGVGEGGEREHVSITPESEMRSRSPQVTVNVANITDPRLAGRYLASSEGHNAVLNVIGINAQKVRKILR